ncbi:hypothetical protein [Campylobacter sp. US33a]|uniref:hypothetical protein n=1 Tax=Campylobacter sp. US33a TaxID=2498120 RepID=UPI001067E15B|nr:hypothetical protein [Campylobacter sp. US33a]TEY03466.1 hypothetical protein ELQ16_02625 [Campylobacter sp. US33a]
MNISNLNELLNTQILNEGSTLSVGGFALNSSEVKPSFAFFSNDEEEIKRAVEKGAFVIVCDKIIDIKDKEVYLLKSENLENAILRLLRFLCEEKECKFLFCSKRELEFCKVFNLKILHANAFLDFTSLIRAKKGEIFCLDNENYLSKLCANYEILKAAKVQKFQNSSPFYSTLICNDLYFKNLKLPFIYTEIFAKFVFFLQENKLKIHFDLNKLNLFKIYFVNKAMQIVEFGTSSKAFIAVENEEELEFWQENFKGFGGLKSALKNSLFCDFSYSKISDLKQIKDFKYILVLLENFDEFENEFVKNANQEQKLFDFL